MRSSKLFILFFTGLICALTLLFVFVQNAPAVKTISFRTPATLGSTNILVGFARTQAQWVVGLSGQKSLAENHGLLFLFDKPDRWGIWTKDMLFPIDVVWLDQDRTVIFIRSDFLPSSYPEVASPPSDALSVLELPAGFVNLHQIHMGDRFVLGD